jgi:hypothetical protein
MKDLSFEKERSFIIPKETYREGNEKGEYFA